MDPRDQVLEVGHPAYRVYFWASPSESDEWELSDCDVDDALDWTQANRRGRRFSLWLVAQRERGVELFRLKGEDPSAPIEDSSRC